ncbi:NADAR family protein [Photorhabdus noenieputensis]|uniref:NADAR family protein n=1 Tax=Photorhabdus noenieputensis TaxID=1208607 RepID=UPI001BD5E4E8|nr:NADAR domain-containing protein [Photorhabdus noenieputensis]MBS9439923.1 NADAR family protein [Photorhabdus noenieputensis]MCK3669887.1 NADAR domain-containing protein [Photorhabdus noenieputensis]
MIINNTIYFYKVNEPYGCFSNFSKHGLAVNGVYWPTVEHYFQANKFFDVNIRENIRRLNLPRDAANAGRDRKKPLRTDWEEVKDNIMRFAVLEKFKQHKEIREILLSTGNTRLIEHTKNDFYWADGGDGSGKNMLGIILMEVREQLKKF